MVRVEVKPDLLRWARERSGLGIDALTRRFPKLDAWESGAARPTFKQLEQFAEATFTPIGFLFLQAPPDEPMPIPDFRTLGNAAVARLSPHLRETIHSCQQRQEWYRVHALRMREERLAFVGSARTTSDVVATAAAIRSTLGFDLEQRRRLSSWNDALRSFLEQADHVGILVMCSGVVLNNNQRRLDPAEFRGFALVDDVAPLVFVNGADTKAAQMFTLAHELAHVWLGESGLSDVDAATVSRQRVERWCNQVAAEVLVPLAVLRDVYDPRAAPGAECKRLAASFKVSTLVMLRRMHDAGGLTAEELRDLYAAELGRLQAKPKGSGGDFYATLCARVSKRFARALVTATLEGQQSFTEAFALLGIHKVTTLDDLGHRLGVGY